MLILFLTGGHYFTSGQCPESIFTLPSTACTNQNFELENTSLNANSYEWDFCSGDFVDIPTASVTLTNLLLNFSFDIEILEESGMWYGFAVSRTGDKLLRLDFGNSLETSPTITDLGTILGFNDPNAISFYKEDGIWYSVIGNLSNSDLVLLSFDSGLDSAPTSEILSGVITFSSIGDIELISDGTNVYGFLSTGSDGDLHRLDFGNSIENIPVHSSMSFTGLNALTSLTLIKECDGYYGLVTGFSEGEVHRMNFGTDLSSTPTTDQLSIGVSLSNAAHTELVSEGTNFYGIVQLLSGSIVKIEFGNSMSNTPTGAALGNLGVLGSSVFAFDLVSDSSEHYGFSVGFSSNSLYQIDFSGECYANYPISSSFEPTINFSQSGIYQVTLKTIDEDGNTNYTNQSINITTDVASNISFLVDDSRCITNANSFTPSTPGLNSYDWDFDGDGMVDVSDPTGSDQMFDYSGLGPGTYTVRLDVSDGTCDNFYEQQITIYPAPPMPSFTAISSECANTDITFTNTTDESQHTGIMLYKWDFDNDGIVDSTDPNPTYSYSTPGVKTVILTDSIPGCSATSTPFDITINPGPTANFFAPTTCQGEAMQFTNTSADAISYFWDFTDGFTSTNPNPSHIFSAAGNYFVELTATDGSGCSDTQIIELAVSDSPQISFDFDIPCTSVNGTQFFDLSTVDNADIASWTWFVNDVEVSTDQNPQIVFSTTGIKNIRLNVQSSNGCESSYSEDIDVLSAPDPDFDVSIGCQGEDSAFTDNTISAGNSIISWFWTVEGVNYSTQDINHVFSNAGLFDVTLEVTGQNFCSESVTKTIEIIQLPSVDFSIDGECDNQLIVAIDNSSSSDDPVISRRWMLDGSNVGNGSQLFLENLSDATYELELELETTSGCIISSSEILEINEAPQSSFSSSRTYGIPGDQLIFTNTSSGEISNEWLLEGNPISTNPDSRTILFEESGIYTVSLVTQNSLGCYDTANQEILIAVPEVDLAIGSFELVQENNTGRIFLEVLNFSNLPVEITEAQIVLENEFSVTEQILEYVGINESKLVSLNVGIPLTTSEPAYFCVSLASQYVDYPDIDPVNNEKCVTIEPNVRVEDPFPNPVTDQFRLKVIAPEDGMASLMLINSAGKVMKSNTYDSTEGLNNFFIEMSTLDPGIYHIVVELLGTTHKRKVIKL